MHAYNRDPDAYYTLNLCARERLDVDADGDTEHPRCVGNCAVWLSVCAARVVSRRALAGCHVPVALVALAAMCESFDVPLLNGCSNARATDRSDGTQRAAGAEQRAPARTRDTAVGTTVRAMH